MRNAILAMSSNTSISTTREDISLIYSTTLDTLNKPSTSSSRASKLTTQAGSLTSSRAIHTIGTFRTNAIPNLPSDIFVNSSS